MLRNALLVVTLLLSGCAADGGKTAPRSDEFKVRFTTSAGAFVVRVVPEWAPLGAARFRTLVESGFYDGARFFRVLPGFVAQFGINGDPAVTRKWDKSEIKDDPVKQSNTRGRITFATAGPDTRTTQVFINYSDKNSRLDAKGFSPFGDVVEGLEVVDKLYAGYGEGAPQGKGPDQDRIEKEGNGYLQRDFPKLDFIESARLVAP
jgi:peptidyl-prolyl cis-trans isomerase A (cyclophilin A)